MTDDELLAVGGPYDGHALRLGSRSWEIDTWKPAPLAASLYDIGTSADPVRDALASGTRTRYIRTRFSLVNPSRYGESHGFAWVLVPEDYRPGPEDGEALTAKLFEGLAAAFLGTPGWWGTFADYAAYNRYQLDCLIQTAYEREIDRELRAMVYGTGTPRHTGLTGFGITGAPGDDDPVLGGIMRFGHSAEEAATAWRDFFDALAEHELFGGDDDTWSVEHTADDCWRCDAAPAASSIGLCEPCRDDLRAPVPA